MSTEESVAREQPELVEQFVKPIEGALQDTGDSGYDGNNTTVDKGSQIIIPFQPLNPILAANPSILQSSAILEVHPQPINISSIHGTANEFNSKGQD